MQFYKIDEKTTLSQLSDAVGDRNVSHILAVNGLNRTRNIGKQFKENCDNISKVSEPVDWKRQTAILNKFTGDSDIFEEAALMSQTGWKVMSNMGTFNNALLIPDSITIPDSVDVLGNGQPVNDITYKKAMNSLQNSPHYIEPAIFNNYSVIKPSVGLNQATSGNDI